MLAGLLERFLWSRGVPGGPVSRIASVRVRYLRAFDDARPGDVRDEVGPIALELIRGGVAEPAEPSSRAKATPDRRGGGSPAEGRP